MSHFDWRVLLGAALLTPTDPDIPCIVLYRRGPPGLGVSFDSVATFGEVDLSSPGVAAGFIHFCDTVATTDVSNIPGLDELGEDTANLPPGHVDAVGDVARGEFVAEAPVLPGDRGRGVAPSVDNLGATDDGEVLPQR